LTNWEDSVETVSTDVSQSRSGLLLVLIKIGAKFAKFVPKMLKAILSFKMVGAVTSVGFYAYLFTWQMGLVVVSFIVVHEYGHILAMKKCGIKTKGIYLIPGLGGVAMASERWKSARDEAYIAVGGPLFSLVYIIPALALYYFSGNPMFAAIAFLTSFINLFNLFPVNPLDGGRIVKALMYSINASKGFFTMMIMMVLAWAVSFNFGLGLLAYISVIGFYELVFDYGLAGELARLVRTIHRALGLYAIYYLQHELFLMNSMLISALDILFIIVIIALYIWDAISSTKKSGRWIGWYPIIVLTDIPKGIKELSLIDRSKLKMKEQYDPMSKNQMFIYAFLMIVTAVIMVSVMLLATSVPGFSEARELLQ
jgi:Zn-dependent protease